MVFGSLTFLLVFLPLLCLCYYPLRSLRAKNAVLLVFSLVFYAWGEPGYVLVMLASVFVAYLGGLLIAHARARENERLSRAVLWGTVTTLLLSLVFFKYLGLFADGLGVLLGREVTVPRPALPIGISFYTFQILSYVIDLHRGRVGLQKNYFTLLLYVSLFPQLIAGPIVRYDQIEAQLNDRRVSFPDAVRGLERFLFGLAKKVLLADNLAVLSDGLFSEGLGEVGVFLSWVALLAFTLQIYFDFSGYSDMAVGLGRLFGFRFPENFRHPYLAVSVTDFWRRWHVSLSAWFRDYVYVPLGGNRKGAARHVISLLVTWALTGLWHGAAWNFLFWGLYYALLLLLEKYAFGRIRERFPRPILRLGTFVLTMLGWLVFRAESLPAFRQDLAALFGASAGDVSAVFAAHPEFVLASLALPVGLFCAFPILHFDEGHERIGTVLLRDLFCLLLFGLCMIQLIASGYNPFIYFRF